MSNPIIYNISYESYINLISKIESKFNDIKLKLSYLDIILSHPSVAVTLTSTQLFKMNTHFKKESEFFGTTNNFYKCLLLVNYHLGSLLQISNNPLLKDNIKTISLSVEDFLIIESFTDL